METQERDIRLFGTFGLSLAVIGLLVPFIIAAIATDDDIAGGFFILAEVLAFTFGIIGRKSLAGRVAIYMTGAALVIILLMVLIKAG